jgi:hypothetical protein
MTHDDGSHRATVSDSVVSALTRTATVPPPPPGAAGPYGGPNSSSAGITFRLGLRPSLRVSRRVLGRRRSASAGPGPGHRSRCPGLSTEYGLRVPRRPAAQPGRPGGRGPGATVQAASETVTAPRRRRRRRTLTRDRRHITAAPAVYQYMSNSHGGRVVTSHGQCPRLSTKHWAIMACPLEPFCK